MKLLTNIIRRMKYVYNNPLVILYKKDNLIQNIYEQGISTP